MVEKLLVLLRTIRIVRPTYFWDAFSELAMVMTAILSLHLLLTWHTKRLCHNVPLQSPHHSA